MLNSVLLCDLNLYSCGEPALCPLQCHQACIVTYPLERDDRGQIHLARYPVCQAFESHTWLWNSVHVVLPRRKVPDFPPLPWAWLSPQVTMFRVPVSLSDINIYHGCGTNCSGRKKTRCKQLRMVHAHMLLLCLNYKIHTCSYTYFVENITRAQKSDIRLNNQISDPKNQISDLWKIRYSVSDLISR